MKKICSVYSSPKQQGTYLYVEKAAGLARVPDDLLTRFGKPNQVMTLLLHPQRTLAQVDVNKVLTELETHGYFLQLSPQEMNYMNQINNNNYKM